MDQNHTATTDRLQWVDTAKSLGLLLVIWGHLLYGGLLGGGKSCDILFSYAIVLCAIRHSL